MDNPFASAGVEPDVDWDALSSAAWGRAQRSGLDPEITVLWKHLTDNWHIAREIVPHLSTRALRRIMRATVIVHLACKEVGREAHLPARVWRQLLWIDPTTIGIVKREIGRRARVPA